MSLRDRLETIRNEPAAVEITAGWLTERRGVPADQLGEELVAAYDATFPRVAPRTEEGPRGAVPG